MFGAGHGGTDRKVCDSDYSHLPRSTEAKVIGRQMLRSGTCVGAQYREATRAKSVADFVSKAEGSLQEVEETRYWLELPTEPTVVKETERDRPLIQETDELAAIFMASVGTAKRSR